jgi:hypothetical protein
MKLDEQVCSLELAKKLKELGVKQDSLFWWVNGHGRFELYDHPTDDESISGFTVAELGAMLPKAFISWTDKVVGNECWLCDDRYVSMTTNYTMASTEADARAKMLIYLFENKQLTTR